MKRSLSIAAMLMVLPCLFATIYRSNELGQRLEVAESMSETGYLLDVQEDVECLYLDGNLVRRTVRSNTESGVLIVEEDCRTDVTSTRQYTDGLLVRETIGDTSVSYGYIENHLAFCSTFIGDDPEPVSIIFFLRSSDDGTLVAVRTEDGLRFISDSYLVQTGSLYQMVSGNLVVQGDYTVNGDGTIQHQEGGTTYIYSADGLLLETREGDVVTTFTYDGSMLASTTRIDGGTTVIETYLDGRLSETRVQQNGILARQTLHRDGGNVQVLY
ncbi:MAG: hypothetical protein IJ863_05570 [Spirochaetales bacterium]|nr:hypothetical protein [Spirochaetales bacterium]